MAKLSEKWYSGVDDRDAWAQYVSNSSDLLIYLTKMIKKEIESLEAPTDITDASWAIRMAERQGQLKVYRNMLKMVDLTKE